jgi:hypothetical protein
VDCGTNAPPHIGGGMIRSVASSPKKTPIRINAAGCRKAAFANAQTHIKRAGKRHENYIVWCDNVGGNTRRVDPFF